MKILTFTTLFPNAKKPDFGIFIKNRMAAVKDLPGVELKVIAPVPFFPPLKFTKKWYTYSQIPKCELIDGIEVFHPRYFVTPKVGMTFYGLWMFLGALGCVNKLKRDFSFDLIDAHYVFPDGFAAILLGLIFKKPVVISARGTDVNLYSHLPVVKNLLRFALKRADHLIAVSNSLGEVMIKEGVERKSVSIIPNGINPHRFTFDDLHSARKKLNLEATAKILVTVGNLVELKGMHLLIDAIQLLKQQGKANFKTYIIGDGELKPFLKCKIADYGLEKQVELIGRVANENLTHWYNAADLFFLGSSREGWPNVVCEAQACGLPVVATAVNGIPEIIDSEAFGLLVERTPDDFARGIIKALNRDWDRGKIAFKGQQRTWENVALEVHDLFLNVLDNAKN